jgi:hypothetical protein
LGLTMATSRDKVAKALEHLRNGRERTGEKKIASLKADKSVPEAEKKEGLAQLEAVLKNARPVQFKENIALVLKYFDKLAPLMLEQDSDLRPAD